MNIQRSYPQFPLRGQDRQHSRRRTKLHLFDYSIVWLSFLRMCKISSGRLGIARRFAWSRFLVFRWGVERFRREVGARGW